MRTFPDISLYLRRLGFPLLILAAAVLVPEWGVRGGWLGALDTAYSDAWHRIAETRQRPEHVAVIAVDQATLDAHPDEPLAFWGPHFARAIERLHSLGVSVVGLDFLLAVSPDNWLSKIGSGTTDLSRVYDAGLRARIASGDVFLVASQLRDEKTETTHYVLPHTDYLLAIPDLDLSAYLGLADVTSDQDGVVRHFINRFPASLAGELEGLKPPELGFPALLALRHLQSRRQTTSVWTSTAPQPLTFFGPPGSMPTISMQRLEFPNYAEDTELRSLKGKVVIIGANFPGMGDLHFTPYATGFGLGRGRLMAGAELQANVVETLLSGQAMQYVSSEIRMIFSAMLALIALTLMLRATLTTGAITAALLLLAGPVFGYALFSHFWLLSSGAWQAAVLIAFAGGLALKFTGEARQRMHMARVFSRYVSDAAVKILLRSEKMPEMGGELQQVTVLFSDIRNFTTISEILKPDEVVEMLNAYFERLCEPVLEEGGSIDKFIGDAIMAEFGAPLPLTDHPLRAVRAALRMAEIATEFCDWMQNRFPARGLPPFAIGIGVHTGPAIIGSIGSKKRSEYTAIGDTVNVASRLEGVTKELKAVIAVSDAVIKACTEQIKVGKSMVVTVKGHREPVQVHEVLAIERG